jgi:hypothetical protein
MFTRARPWTLILMQMNTVYPPPPILVIWLLISYVHLGLPNCLFWCFGPKYLNTCHFIHTHCTVRQCRPPWINPHNSIRWRVQIMTFPIVQFSPVSCYSLFLKWRFSRRCFVLRHLPLEQEFVTRGTRKPWLCKVRVQGREMRSARMEIRT